MKKLGFLLAAFLMLVLVQAKANHQNSDLNITSNEGHYITVQLDDDYFSTPQQKVRISNVQDGNHFIRVYNMFRRHHNSQYQRYLVYEGNIKVSPSSIVDISVSERQVYVQSRSANSYSNCQPLQSNTNYQNYSHGNAGYSQTFVGYGTPSFGGNSNPSCGQGNSWNQVPTQMSERDFQDLVNVVRNTSFDSSRLSVAKQAAAGGQLDSYQVRQLMNELSFESSKLDFVKFAYRYVKDPSRYYVVNSGFSFSSSIDELNEFIAVY